MIYTMEDYRNLVLDEERALYGLRSANVTDCRFEGPADGESALKECSDLFVAKCDFRLRYPLWHARESRIVNCTMSEACRAPLWYDSNLLLRDCEIDGVKAVRECRNVTIEGGRAHSTEFGWRTEGLRIRNFDLTSEIYPFFMSSDLEIDALKMTGKYAFQYVKNMAMRNSVLNTKDVFWHCENVTLTDCTVNGEYLGWYSRNLKLVRCHISGTQPFCYCDGLVLEDCTMENCDLAFENSHVTATVKGHIDSVKNPLSGSIRASSIGEIILDEHLSSVADCDIIQEDK